MKLKYLPDGKLLIQEKKEKKSSSGVFYAQENSVESAKVLQTGEGVKAKVGDMVLFKTWAPNHYQIGGEEYAIIDEKYVDAIL